MTLTRPWSCLCPAALLLLLQHSGVCAPGHLLIPHLFKKWESGAAVFSSCKSIQLLRSHSCYLKLFLLPAPIPCLWQDWLNWNTRTEEHPCFKGNACRGWWCYAEMHITCELQPGSLPGTLGLSRWGISCVGWLSQAELLSLTMEKKVPKNYCCSEDTEEKTLSVVSVTASVLYSYQRKTAEPLGSPSSQCHTVPLEFSITFHMNRLKVLRQNGQGECSN